MNLARWTCCESRCCEHEEPIDVEVVATYGASAHVPGGANNVNGVKDSQNSVPYPTCHLTLSGVTNIGSEAASEDTYDYEQLHQALEGPKNDSKEMHTTRGLALHSNQTEREEAKNGAEETRGVEPAPRCLARVRESGDPPEEDPKVPQQHSSKLDLDFEDRTNVDSVAEAPLPPSKGLFTYSSPPDVPLDPESPEQLEEQENTWALGPDTPMPVTGEPILSGKLSL